MKTVIFAAALLALSPLWGSGLGDCVADRQSPTAAPASAAVAPGYARQDADRRRIEVLLALAVTLRR